MNEMNVQINVTNECKVVVSTLKIKKNKSTCPTDHTP